MVRTGPAVVLVAVACRMLVAAQAAVPRPGPAPTVLWQVPGTGHGRPVSDGLAAYFLSSHHEVIAVDRESGALRWTASTSEPGGSTEGSALALAGDVVVAGDYNLVAFDRLSGNFRWRFVPVVGYAPGIYLGDARSGVVLAGSPAGRIYAVEAASGEPRWVSTVASDGKTTVFQPTTDGSLVIAGYTTFVAPNIGGVVALDLATGRELWRTAFPVVDPRFGTGSAGGPVLTESDVIASAGDGVVYVLDRSNGSLRWTIPPLNLPPPFPPPPPIVQAPVPASGLGADYRPLVRWGTQLFVGSLKGPVVSYDLAARRQLWMYRDPRSGSVSFALAGDDLSVYVPFVSGRHVALDLATGRERWRTTEVRDDFNWPAAPGADRVFLAGGRGGFVALRR